MEQARLWAFSRYRWQQMAPETVAERLRPRLEQTYGRWHSAQSTVHVPEAWLRILVEGLQGEAHTLQEMVRLSAFAFVERFAGADAEAQTALSDTWAASVLRHCLRTLSPEALATPLLANAFFRDLRHHFRASAGIRGRQVMFPIRAALAGSMQGPCLGVVATLLGSSLCAQRIEECLACLPDS